MITTTKDELILQWLKDNGLRTDMLPYIQLLYLQNWDCNNFWNALKNFMIENYYFSDVTKAQLTDKINDLIERIY